MHLDLRLTRNVGPSIVGNRVSITVIDIKLVEVEFSFLQAQVSDCPRRHQAPLYIARFGVAPFANHDVTLVGESLLQTRLLTLLVCIVSCGDINWV